MRTTEMGILKHCDNSDDNIKDRNSINIDNPVEEPLITKNKEGIDSKSKKKYVIFGIILLLVILLIAAGVGIYIYYFLEKKYNI